MRRSSIWRPKRARVEVLDLLDSCYGRFHDLLRHTFQAAINDAPRLWHGFYQLLGQSQFVEGQIDGLTRLRNTLRDVLRGLQPDVVVSTCPIYSFLIEEIYRDGRTRDFTPDFARDRCRGQGFALAADIERLFCRGQRSGGAGAGRGGRAGKEDRGVRFPGAISGEGPREKEIAPPDLAAKGRPRILYVINSARKKSPKLLDRLLEHPDWDVTVCVGRDTDLDEMARAKAATAPERMEVIGHIAPDAAIVAGASRRHQQGRGGHRAGGHCRAMSHDRSQARVGPGRGQFFAAARGQCGGARPKSRRKSIDWLERAFRDEGRLLALWRKNLEPLGKPDSALNLARFILEQAATAAVPVPKLRALPAPEADDAAQRDARVKLRHLPKKLLLCDLHTHTTWSDGKLSVPEMVDFYGQRGFDCLCITDHLCDPKRLLGKLVNLTGLVIPPGEMEAYFEEIEREKKRAWAKYDLLLMTGVEFNKDGYTAKTSTHLLGVDLKQPIDPSLDIKELIAEIHAQGGLAIASHPHEMKSEWGKDTLYLWEHVDEYAPLLDAWEVANRDDIFNPVGLKKLPFIASSDFHKPKHIHSWKTLLYCEKEAEAIKHCIRVNRDVSITLYRDHRFGLDEHRA